MVYMLNALAVQLNMFHVCYGSQVKIVTTDIVARLHTFVKNPVKSQISIWSLSSESKGVSALLFKLNYIVLYAYAFMKVKQTASDVHVAANPGKNET